jgi:hypothetical protein
MKSGASDPFEGDGDDAEAERDPADESEVTPSTVDGGEVAADAGENDEPQRDGTGTTEESHSGDESSGVVDGGAQSEDTGNSLDRSQIPYTLRRNNVKDERPHVHQLFVTDETDDAAREVERDLEDLLDTDIYRLDAREAIYRIGMRHPEEVAELLEEWGYNF